MAASHLKDQDIDFISNFSISDNDFYGTGIFDSTMTAQQVEPPKYQAALEPTPIAQHGVVVVEKLPIATASWLGDRSFLDSLKNLLSDPSSLSLDQGSRRACKPRMMYKTQSSTSLPVVSQGWTTGTKSTSIVNLEPASDSDDSDIFSSFRSSHVEQWNQRYRELVRFQKQNGHCLVPLNWPTNPSLAHWVKRQRYQFRMKREGKHSTLTEERQTALESLGFVWDSHAAGWEERWNELREFKERHGHCNVPKKYPENQQLAVWVKCQRRQFKLFSCGENSNMTRGRIEKLQMLGFVFDPRSRKKRMNMIPL